MREQTIRSLVLGKWADYRPVLPDASVRFLARDEYLDAARADPTICVELATGWWSDFEAEFRDPVLADVDDQLVTVCPPLMAERVDPEPPRIQRAYVEGAFLRRLFRFLVEGEGWEADAQVRDVMARHYPFQPRRGRGRRSGLRIRGHAPAVGTRLLHRIGEVPDMEQVSERATGRERIATWWPLWNWWAVVLVAGIVVFAVAALVTAGRSAVFVLVVVAIGVVNLVPAPLRIVLWSDDTLHVRRLVSREVLPIADVVVIRRTGMIRGTRGSYTGGRQYAIVHRGGVLFVPIGPRGAQDVLDHVLARNPEIERRGA